MWAAIVKSNRGSVAYQRQYLFGIVLNEESSRESDSG